MTSSEQAKDVRLDVLDDEVADIVNRALALEI